MEGLRCGGGLAVLGYSSLVSAIRVVANRSAVREEEAGLFCIPPWVADVGVGDLVLRWRAESGVGDREFGCSIEYSEGEVDRIEPRLSS